MPHLICLHVVNCDTLLSSEVIFQHSGKHSNVKAFYCFMGSSSMDPNWLHTDRQNFVGRIQLDEKVSDGIKKNLVQQHLEILVLENFMGYTRLWRLAIRDRAQDLLQSPNLLPKSQNMAWPGHCACVPLSSTHWIPHLQLLCPLL